MKKFLHFFYGSRFSYFDACGVAILTGLYDSYGAWSLLAVVPLSIASVLLTERFA